MSLKPGSSLPDLTLAASGGRSVNLRKDFAGRKLVLYFYPKDNTPGCTLEGQDFARLHPEFQKLGADIVGVSRDSVKSHDNFCSKFGFPFSLLSDADETLCNAFGVMADKKLYGREYRGVDRSTFLFDAKGKLVREWRAVKAKGHADAVLEAVQAL